METVAAALAPVSKHVVVKSVTHAPVVSFLCFVPATTATAASDSKHCVAVSARHVPSAFLVCLHPLTLTAALLKKH